MNHLAIPTIKQASPRKKKSAPFSITWSNSSEKSQKGQQHKNTKQTLIQVGPKTGKERKNPYGVSELGAELLNDKSEAARDLLEHGIGEGPVLLRRDLLREPRRSHLQL